MSTLTIVLLIILAVLVVGLIVLYFMGKKMQKKQAEQQEQMEASQQTVTMFVIDKKKLPLNKSGLPQIAIDQTPKILRRSKVPIVKAKIGPRTMTMIADEKAYDLIPLKKEVKAVISGMYIMDVKKLHAPLETPEKKQGFWKRMRSNAQKTVDEANREDAAKRGKKPSGKNKK